MNDVVVLLPGILGSALAKDGKTVWDVRGGAVGRALLSLGGSIEDLELDGDGSDGGSVTPTHLLSDVHLVPGLCKIDGYSGLSTFIQEKFGAVPGANYFEFPYDWRLDNRVAARRLQEQAAEWLDAWRSRPEGEGAQLVFVAHSMGGLVARHYLECLGGWRDTRLLITLGTPHRGSVNALDFLVNGFKKKLGPVTLLDLTETIRSFPSVHQLLPIYPCVGAEEDDLQRIEELDELGELDMERARAGIAFHREIEAAVERNRRDDEYRDANYRLRPVVGTYQPTFLSALRTPDGVRPLRTYRGKSMLDGDGTVPRLSATPIELSDDKVETFVACPHASLQNFKAVRVQVRASLDDYDLSEIKAVAPAEHLGLELAGVFLAGERFRARARRVPPAPDALPARLTNLESGEETEVHFEPTDEAGWQRLDLPPLPAATYRLQVEPGLPLEPIADVFVVIGE